MRPIVDVKAWIGIFLVSLALSACGTSKSTPSPGTEDGSASGTAAGAVGGALSGSGSGGTLAFLLPRKENTLYSLLQREFELIPSAFASGSCPTFATTGSGCTASGSSLWLSYPTCSFGSSAASWTGTQTLVMSSGSAACGTFPNPGSGTLSRQFVTGSSGAAATTPGTATQISSLVRLRSLITPPALPTSAILTETRSLLWVLSIVDMDPR